MLTLGDPLDFEKERSREVWGGQPPSGVSRSPETAPSLLPLPVNVEKTLHSRTKLPPDPHGLMLFLHQFLGNGRSA